MGYMTFGEALKALREGKRIHRIGWRDRGKFLWLSRQTGVDCSTIGDAAGSFVSPVICLLRPNEDGSSTILPGWTPLQCDMLTDDWEVV